MTQFIVDSYRRRRRDVVAAFLYVVAIAMLLREPLLRYGELTYATADVTQYLSPTTVAPDYVVRNPLLTDPVTQFIPWLEFNRTELAQGRVPLWNPLNGCGAPHLANYQSAVFSPFSLPFYVLGLKPALLISAAARLFLIAFGAYLFLRRLHLSHWAAWSGGAVFAYCGHNALLISYPHSAVVAWLPFALEALEVLLSTMRVALSGHRAPRTRGTWARLIAVLTLSIYSGHPETLAFSGLVIALYALARSITIVRSCGAWRDIRTHCIAMGARLVGAAALAVGLGAPQLLPFLEYLHRSTTLADRSAVGPQPLDTASWPRYFFPDLLGTPMRGAFAVAQPPPNYEAATLGHVGALALLLALFGLRRAWSDRRARVFVGMALSWPLWAHDVFGLAQLVDRIPLLRHLPIPVSQSPFALSVAITAAFGIDACVRSSRRSPRTALVTAVTGAVVLAAFRHFGLRFLEEGAVRLGASSNALDAARAHVAWITAATAAGVGAFALLHALQGTWVRRIALALLTCVLLEQSGRLLAAYNTSCPSELVYPRPPQMRHLLDTVRDERVLIVGTAGITACSNMMYGIDQPAIYDGLEIADYGRLYARVFRAPIGWREARRSTGQALSLFGVEWLLVKLDQADLSPNSPWRQAREGKNPRLQPRGQVGVFDLFESTRSAGRFWSLAACEVATSREQAFERVTASDFDARARVVVGPEGLDQLTTNTESSSWGTVRVEERSPMRIRLTCEAPRDTWLVTTIPWYPGWRATIDRVPQPLVRANFAFAGVRVPPGEHAVELEYAPASWSFGLGIAALAAIIAAATASVSWRRAQRK